LGFEIRDQGFGINELGVEGRPGWQDGGRIDTQITEAQPQLKLSKRTERILSIVLAIVVPLSMLGLLEGIAYLWEKKQADSQYAWELVASRRLKWIPFPEPDPGYTLMKPDRHYKWQGIPVDINSHGLRSPETPYEKPANSYRILNLGDSVVMGWGVEQDETYGQLLQGALNNSAASDMKFEVINAGVPGWNLGNALAYLKTEGVKYQPDLILFDVTIVNDIYGENALARQNQSPVIEWLRANTYTWPFLSIQMQWVKARSEGQDRIDVIDPPKEARSYFPLDENDERWDQLWGWIEGMALVAKENDSDFALILFPMEFQVLDPSYSTLAQDILAGRAEAAGIPALDLLPAFRAACREKPGGMCQLEDRYLFADVWMHPSELGHRITATELERFLQPILSISD
jgi:lysophospholipase L1-like esterase